MANGSIVSALNRETFLYCYVVFSGNATRRCMSDGQWYVSPRTNDTWTNYTQCMKPRPQQTVPQLIAVRFCFRFVLEFDIGR